MSNGKIRVRLPMELLDELARKDFAGGGLATNVFSAILVMALTEFRPMSLEELQETFETRTPRQIKLAVNRLVKDGWVDRLDGDQYTISDRVRQIYREYEVGES